MAQCLSLAGITQAAILGSRIQRKANSCGSCCRKRTGIQYRRLQPLPKGSVGG
ncbi:MAG: hypothetical protein QXV17_02065 [Candidatus Micrarchaeaceae archaeon]